MRKKETKKKKQNVKIPGYLVRKVPYSSCYEQMGMIETEPGTFSRSYEILLPEDDVVEEFDIVKVRECMGNILSRVVRDYSCQMLVRNSREDEDVCLSRVLLPEKGEPRIDAMIRDYNEVIRDNIGVGHNNYRRTVQFVASVQADCADDALKAFEELDPEIRSLFSEMYGYKAVGKSLDERLYDVYGLFNPGEKTYGEFVEMRKENPKTGTKELVYPRTYEWKNRDYLVVGKRYVRMLFINSLPTAVPDSVLTDLMSVSSDIILSVIYEPIDTALGAKTAAKLVEDNTRIRKIAVRDTVEDRKKHTTKEKIERIHENEEAYFYSEANKVFSDAIGHDESVMLASFVIALFADTKEDLDRDTKLLRLSASKYASQIRTCDLMQDEAFQSVLPLAHSRLNVSRTFRSGQLAAMQPLDVQQLFNETNAFHGLNGISDNLILLDRKNYTSGMICGIEHSGKSFACKREIANALMVSDDEAIVITSDTDAYLKFVSAMGGTTAPAWAPDVFAAEGSERLKGMFLEGFLHARLSAKIRQLKDADRADAHARIADEAKRMAVCGNVEEAGALYKENPAAFGSVTQAMRGYKITPGNLFGRNERLKMVSVKDESELVLMMQAALEHIRRLDAEGKKAWLFIDSIDQLFYSQEGSDYLAAVLSELEEMKTCVTVVVQSSVHILANQDAAIEYDYMLGKFNFYKLLAQGPVERRTYTKRLNIPQALVGYITDREPGEGIIITPSANIVFNDRFAGRDDPFYARFY